MMSVVIQLKVIIDLMYTGIVLGTEKIKAIQTQQGYQRILVANTQGYMDDVFIGASVAVDGTCLTVCEIAADLSHIGFDISQLSLDLTTLKWLRPGALVNIERSFKLGMENGGHSLYGHIEGITEVITATHHGETLHLELKIPTENMRYFFLKGFIGLHGCSLTINQVNKVQNLISIDLIPETLRLTNLNAVQVGDFLNYEIDQSTRTMVDTIEGIFQNQFKQHQSH